MNQAEYLCMHFKILKINYFVLRELGKNYWNEFFEDLALVFIFIWFHISDFTYAKHFGNNSVAFDKKLH